MARKRSGQDSPPAGAPAWMMTYGDLVTQILAFFVLLFSFSTLNEHKFREALISLQGSFGVLPGAKAGMSGDQSADPTHSTVQASPQVREQRTTQNQQLRQVGDLAERMVKSEGLEQNIIVWRGEKEITIEFNAQALFDSGRAQIKPEAESALDALAQFLLTIPNEVRVEGHTDSDPISTLLYPSNWELSGARAASVVRYLIDFGNVPPNRMSVAGYADWKPVAPNDTPANKARNRRVDIVILSLSN